jgi:hypothetical protein
MFPAPWQLEWSGLRSDVPVSNPRKLVADLCKSRRCDLASRLLYRSNVMVTARAFTQSIPLSSEVSTTLAVGADFAFEIFADIADVPRWLPIVQRASVLERTEDGRARRVAFMRRLERGSLGYTLEYSYDRDAHTIAWTTPATSNVVLSGEARFVPLSTRACLMTYRLVIDLPIVDDLVSNELDGHPASFVVAEFREHLRRL